ncbi:MAG: hypothetical protein PVI57_16330 [Gemmatimonadota bacterium]|jgi:hypothetical protein
MLRCKTTRWLPPLFLALALATACSEGDPLTPTGDLEAVRSGATAWGASMRPLTQSSRGTMAAVGPCAGGVRFAAAGTGNATHVGRFEIDLEWCMDPVGGAILGGEAAIRAANGDRIVMSLGGQATSATSLRMVAAIIGGSGRFEDASGRITVDVILGAGGRWESTGRGEISY